MAAVGGEPLYSLFESGDSLHIHGDSIFYLGDSLGHGLLKIFHRVRIFREDMQGVWILLTYSSIDPPSGSMRCPCLMVREKPNDWRHHPVGDAASKMDSLKIDGKPLCFPKTVRGISIRYVAKG